MAGFIPLVSLLFFNVFWSVISGRDLNTDGGNDIWKKSCPNLPVPHSFSIFVVGDLHGDFQNTLTILKAAGLVSTVNPNERSQTFRNQFQWTGRNNVVVQMGDIVDRGPDSPLIYELFEILRNQAKHYGGEIHHLFGNHESMNLCGDHNSLSRVELKRYFNNSFQNWKQAWSPFGSIGRFVRQHFNIIKVLYGQLLFVHAGLVADFARFSPEDLKSAFLYRVDKQHCSLPTKQSGNPPTTYSELRSLGTFKHDLIYGRISPLWSRVSSEMEESIACHYVNEALDKASKLNIVRKQQTHVWMDKFLVDLYRHVHNISSLELFQDCQCPIEDFINNDINNDKIGITWKANDDGNELLQTMIVGHTPVMMAYGHYNSTQVDLILRCWREGTPHQRQHNSERSIENKIARYIITDAGISHHIANNLKFLQIEISLVPSSSCSVRSCWLSPHFDFYQVSLDRKSRGDVHRHRHFLMSLH